MLDYTDNARNELKRVEHLIYVSLKYTRTVDVIKSIVERLINAYDCLIKDFLDHFEDKIKDDIPESPASKAGILKNLLKDNPKMLEWIEFYIFLRKISRASYKSINEFRRHVTMIANVDGKEVNVDIDIVTEYFHKTKEYIEEAEKIMKGEE